MKNKGVLVGCGIVLFVFFLLFAFVGILLQMGKGGSGGEIFKAGGGGKKVGLLYVSGIITSGRSSSGGLMGDVSSGSDSVVKLLRKSAERSDISAIVIRVNSPGGSAAASQEIFNEIIRIRDEEQIPIIISMGDVAASGGYYISAAADHIMANPASLTGSIGVIMSFLNYEGLMDKVGMESVVLKAGKLKDMGSPYREMTQEERNIIESALESIHEQFITDVAKGRDMDGDALREIADGRIFTGQQALEFELVDSLGGLQDAINLAGETAGLKSPPEVEILQQENPFAMFFSSVANMHPNSLADVPLGRIAQFLLVNPVLMNSIQN